VISTTPLAGRRRWRAKRRGSTQLSTPCHHHRPLQQRHPRRSADGATQIRRYVATMRTTTLCWPALLLLNCHQAPGACRASCTAKSGNTRSVSPSRALRVIRRAVVPQLVVGSAVDTRGDGSRSSSSVVTPTSAGAHAKCVRKCGLDELDYPSRDTKYFN
jgi:hypothetical protein